MNGFKPAVTIFQPPWCYSPSPPFVVVSSGPAQTPAVEPDLTDALVAAAAVGRRSTRVVVFDTAGIAVYARDFGSGEFVGVRATADMLLAMASNDETALTLMDGFDRCRQWVERGVI